MEPPRPRIQALVYRLAVQEEPVPKQHVGFLFWPQRSSDTVSRYVAQLCALTRQILPDRAALIVDEETNIGSLLSKEVLQSIGSDSGTTVACRLTGQMPPTAGAVSIPVD